MRNKLVHTLIIFALFLGACSNGQTQSGGNKNLSATAFSEKIKTENNVQILDVRTPEEFKGGFIAGAVNINWNSNKFGSDVQKIDKSKPVYVYCFSGARSSSAAAYMRKEGFKEVYELSGGIQKWRAAGLPETTENTAQTKELSLADFKKIISENKSVLINFYAEWCVPCKKMKPSIEALTKELKGKIEIIRIDADKNKILTKELNITGVPVLLFYKNSEKKWSNEGYIEKSEIEKNILQ